MKILFFTELHPIRNELTHHRAILLSKWGKKIVNWSAKGNTDGVTIKVACNHFGYMNVNNHLSNLMPFLIPTNFEEEQKIQKNLLPWGAEGVDLWVKLMEGKEDERLVVYRDYLKRIKNTVFDFDVVIFWGLNGYASNCVRELGAVPLFMELASIRNPFPPSVYIDKDGVNGLSSVSKLEYDYISGVSKKLPTNEYLFSHLIDDPLKDVSVLDRKFDFSEKNFSYVDSINSKGLVLVPLQIGDDSNILLSSSFKNTFEFVEHVIDIFKSSDYTLIFKPHPGAISRGGIVFEDHFNAQSLVEKTEGAIWYDEELEKSEYVSFLRQHDAIVTVNSSVGFEGMILGVPVFPLGDAIYKPKGYGFDHYEIPFLIDTESRDFIQKGTVISNFILNLCFFSEDRLEDNPKGFFNRVRLLSTSGNNSDTFNALINNSMGLW